MSILSKNSHYKLKNKSMILFFLVLFLFLNWVSAGNLYAEDGTLARILIVSDIHFSPLDNNIKDKRVDNIFCELLRCVPVRYWNLYFPAFQKNMNYPRYHQGTNYKLLEQSFKKLGEVIPEPAFLLFPGDIVTHHFKRKYIRQFGSEKGFASFREKTFKFVIDLLKFYYPHTPIYYTYGNDDNFSEDYYIVMSGRFLAFMNKQISDKFIINKENRDNLNIDREFNNYGCYTVKYKFKNNSKPINIISLNTIFAATRRDTGNPVQILNWLKKQLQAIKEKNEKAWILCHLSLGIDPYSTAKHKSDKILYFMNDKFNKTFCDIIKEYSDTIKLLVVGHFHKQSFRLFKDKNGKLLQTFINVSPALNPYAYNNPAFQVLYVKTKSFEPVDFTNYYFSLQSYKWNKFTFSKYYKKYLPENNREYNAQNLNKLHSQFSSTEELWEKFIKAFVCFGNITSGLPGIKKTEIKKIYMDALIVN